MQTTQNARGRGPRPAWKALRGRRRAHGAEVSPNGCLVAQLGEQNGDFGLCAELQGGFNSFRVYSWRF